MTEAQLTRAVVRYLRRLRAEGNAIWWAKLAGHPMQRRGLPDLLIIYRGRAVFVELKAPGRKATRLQVETLRRLQDAGAWAVVCRSVDEVETMLAEAAKELV